MSKTKYFKEGLKDWKIADSEPQPADQRSQVDPVSVPSGSDHDGQPEAQEFQKSRIPDIKKSRIQENKNSRKTEVKKSRNPETKDSRKQEKPERVNVNLNLEKTLTERAKIQAVKEGRPFSRLIEAAIEKYMQGR